LSVSQVGGQGQEGFLRQFCGVIEPVVELPLNTRATYGDLQSEMPLTNENADGNLFHNRSAMQSRES
ncbi:MAG: hypothetical protein ACRDJK_02655, partial [Actinomycetota bacterium]